MVKKKCTLGYLASLLCFVSVKEEVDKGKKRSLWDSNPRLNRIFAML